MDGFVLTHAFEAMDIPDQADVDVFLPPYSPRQVLDPDHPYSIGAMVGPEAFTEVRWLAHEHMLAAIPVIERTQKAFQKILAEILADCFRTTAWKTLNSPFSPWGL